MLSGRLWWKPHHGECLKANSRKLFQEQFCKCIMMAMVRCVSPVSDLWEEKSQFRSVGATPKQQAARENPQGEVRLPSPGQQPQLPQKRPSEHPFLSALGKSLPLLVNTLDPHSMHGRVNCCFTMPQRAPCGFSHCFTSMSSQLSHLCCLSSCWHPSGCKLSTTAQPVALQANS